MKDLIHLGFDDFFINQLEQHDSSLIPARVINVERGLYKLINEQGEFSAKISGRIEYFALDGDDFPCVGDWVLLRSAEENSIQVIEQILTRKTKLVRRQAGSKNSLQIIATNIDYVFIVQGCNADFNPRRMERYLVAIADSGAVPVIILNKADIDPENTIQYEAEHVHRVSAKTGDNMESLHPYLEPGKTSVLIGSSGVGKSTLLNLLCDNDLQKTQEIRSDDDKGRHTTTSRFMFFSKPGGLIIDTPGMREFGLFESNVEESGLFDDIDQLTKQCQFKNCTHANQSGCAVENAIEKGELDQSRLHSFEKLKKEVAFHARKSDPKAASNAKSKWKEITKRMRNNLNKKY